ncbi:uncharacterized protein LOC116105211 [Pistacia vera]|uniref:uncharacterized protein LOC116105211 n=1 Tax=Pistacia vera TaxID=55513 RepID=UPI001263A85E|nr:uncharacterized protein LOC116105211 [Pistacia vera]
MAQMLQTMQEQKANMNARFQDLERNTQLLHSHSQFISKLETQIGQIAEAVNRREQSQLPSQVIGNPSGSSQQRGFFEQVKAVMTLRSNQELIRPKREVKVQGREEEGTKPKRVRINIPLLDAIKQVPAYAKFLKGLCTQKRRMKSHTPKTVHLPENVSAVVSNRIPLKLKDLGAPVISCVIGNVTTDRALLDLGASVNLLPTSVYEQFNLGELKSTKVILQLADRSVKMPRGLIEDVLVKVDELHFPVDFLVLDMEYMSSGSMPPRETFSSNGKCLH